MAANRRQIGETMRILVLGVLLLAMGGCAAAGTEERQQWDAALWALGSAMVQFGNQIQVEQQRQRQAQQSMPRQIMCQNVGGLLSCTTY
jgi:hypothetical protein